MEMLLNAGVTSKIDGHLRITGSTCETDEYNEIVYYSTKIYLLRAVFHQYDNLRQFLTNILILVAYRLD